MLFAEKKMITNKDMLLGIDIGTYGSKGVICNSDGQVIASAFTEHQMSLPRPGWAEHDAELIWWRDFVLLVHKLLKVPDIDPRNIAGVGVSAIAPCVLPIDKQGKPLRPAILYGVDTRATEEIKELESELGRKTIINNSGLNLSSQAAGPKILWIRKHEEDVWAKTTSFLTGSGYLVYKLTGEKVIDIYTASAYAPMFNVKQNCWNTEITEIITPINRLPRLLWSMEVAGYVTENAAQETGLITGTPVIAGTADAASEAISSGLNQPGDMMIMYGSSLFFIQKTSEQIRSETFWGHAFLEQNTYSATGGMSTSGSLTRWFRDELGAEERIAEQSEGKNAYEALANMAAKSVVGSNGLIVLPYFSGERSPINDPNARGLIIGLSLSHTRADIYRAILEGVGYGVRHNIEIMNEEGIGPKRILAVGGGTKNPLWLQIVSNIAGIDQYVPDQTIGAAYGDAFMAAVGVQLVDNSNRISEWVTYSSVIRANSTEQAEYENYYQLYRKLYPNNAGTMHTLVKLRG